MNQADTPFFFFAAIAGRLTRYRLAPHGEWQMVDAITLPLTVQYACFHPGRPWVYVLCSNGGVASAGDRHELVAVDLGGPRMFVAGGSVALPDRPIHASVDVRGGRLLVAYNRPAALTVHALDDEGRPQAMQGPFDDAVVVGNFPHQVLPLPGGTGVLLVCRGDDATLTRAENPGSLRVLEVSAKGAACTQVIAPRGGFGFGPRNAAFGPGATWLQVVLERQNLLETFSLKGDKISAEPEFVHTLLQRPATQRHVQLAGAIELGANGRFAYVANRSHAATMADGRKVDAGGENSLVVFALDSGNGRPQSLQTMPLVGLHARCIALSPDGRWLVAAIRESSVRVDAGGVIEQPAGLQCFRVQSDGRLAFANHLTLDDSRGALFWAAFAPAPGATL